MKEEKANIYIVRIDKLVFYQKEAFILYAALVNFFLPFWLFLLKFSFNVSINCLSKTRNRVRWVDFMECTINFLKNKNILDFLSQGILFSCFRILVLSWRKKTIKLNRFLQVKTKNQIAIIISITIIINNNISIKATEKNM